jgi:Flp pilus assembly protein TadG
MSTASLVRRVRERSGQATVEFIFVGVIVLVLSFGVIDFARALIARQVLTNVTREGANLASRTMSLSNAVNAVLVSASPLNLNQSGYVVLSNVARDALGNASVTAQYAQGGMPTASRIGQLGATANMPSTSYPANNESVITAEVFYRYEAVTPLGRFLGLVLPTQLYDVAYF